MKNQRQQMKKMTKKIIETGNDAISQIKCHDDILLICAISSTEKMQMYIDLWKVDEYYTLAESYVDQLVMWTN